ncbi:MAG TPA: YoaK family protein [Gaiellaceae bacterium]
MTTQRRQVALAVWLASVAGFVDAIGYLVLHQLFVAHMTGNTNQLGQRLGRGELAAAVPVVAAVLAFVASITAFTLVLETAVRGRLRSPAAAAFVLEAGLVVVFMLVGAGALRGGVLPDRGPAFYVCLVSAIAAMGAQTAAVTKWGARSVRTTYISGMLTRLGQESALLIAGCRPGPSYVHDRLGLGTRREALGGAAAYLSLWLAFVGGGTLGAFALGRVELWSLVAPATALLAAAAFDWWRPVYA